MKRLESLVPRGFDPACWGLNQPPPSLCTHAHVQRVSGNENKRVGESARKQEKVRFKGSLAEHLLWNATSKIPITGHPFCELLETRKREKHTHARTYAHMLECAHALEREYC